MSASYPSWKFYPSRSPAPDWVEEVLGCFRDVRSEIDSREQSGVSSDSVLAHIRPGLETAGFIVERGKRAAEKISRPVLFGEDGRAVVAYEVDAFHAGHGVVLEVEAGRGAANNADYRDLVRVSLMVDAKFLVVAMMLEYRSGAQRMRSYEQTRNRLDAIYASDRLRLPLEGVLLVGY